MNAQLETGLRFRRMTAIDLDAVMAIETDIYPYPWTRGNFADSLDADYCCWIAESGRAVAGYTVVAIAAGEAHLLNLSIAAPWQRRGRGTELLRFAVQLARAGGARRMFLEVRPSNAAARALYSRAGFSEVGVRRDYYPAQMGREDALVLERGLR